MDINDEHERYYTKSPAQLERAHAHTDKRHYAVAISNLESTGAFLLQCFAKHCNRNAPFQKYKSAFHSLIRNANITKNNFKNRFLEIRPTA